MKQSDDIWQQNQIFGGKNQIKLIECVALIFEWHRAMQHKNKGTKVFDRK